MNRTVENIGLRKYPSSIKELLAFDDPNTFNFVRAMDIAAINSETINIHYTAHQFWEKDGPKKLLMDTVKRLSINEKAYMLTPINSDSRSWHSSQQKMVQSARSGKVEYCL